MILYLDSSAIVKEYISESGSGETLAAVEQAETIATAVLSRVEVIAAFHKAVRVNVISQDDANRTIRAFNKRWRDLVRTRVTERLVKHASELAGSQSLRGYDAVHLASAAAWQQAIGRNVTLATFDLQLWRSARKIGLSVFPENPPEQRRGGR